MNSLEVRKKTITNIHESEFKFVIVSLPNVFSKEFIMISDLSTSLPTIAIPNFLLKL